MHRYRQRLTDVLGLLLMLTGFSYAAAPGACPAPATGAFTGCYYDNQTLSGNPVFVRTDSQINFYWGNDSPDKSLFPLNFSARWQGNFTFDQGNYTFAVIASDWNTKRTTSASTSLTS